MSELELKRRLKEIADYSLMCNEGDDVRLAIDAIEELQARVKELEAQLDELLSGIDKALTMYATGQPMQFVADKLAEVYDKIEAERRS